MATIRGYLRRELLLSRYRFGGFAGQSHQNCSDTLLADPDTLDIVVVAFNDAELIERQHAALHAYLTDRFCYTVVDNSWDEAGSREIQKVCSEHAIGYIRLPKNPYSGRSPSQSHGLALNWTYTHYLRPRSARYFGFLDHDVFPTKSVSLLEQLKRQPVYGHAQSRDERWYLWPGFSFFCREALPSPKLNFMPEGELDTGGGNWPVLYAKLAQKQLAFPAHRYRSLKAGDDVQATKVEYFDDWLHLINASNWKQLADAKDLSIIG